MKVYLSGEGGFRMTSSGLRRTVRAPLVQGAHAEPAADASPGVHHHGIAVEAERLHGADLHAGPAGSALLLVEPRRVVGREHPARVGQELEEAQDGAAVRAAVADALHIARIAACLVDQALLLGVLHHVQGLGLGDPAADPGLLDGVLGIEVEGDADLARMGAPAQAQRLQMVAAGAFEQADALLAFDDLRTSSKGSTFLWSGSSERMGMVRSVLVRGKNPPVR